MINREIPQLLLYTVFPSSDAQWDAEIQGAPLTNTDSKGSSVEYKYIITHQWKEKKKNLFNNIVVETNFLQKI